MPLPPPADTASATLAARIDAALPQTQCTRCGYPDCAAYARAIASGEAAINRCPPGGAEGIARLTRITGRPALPLDPDCGAEGPRRLAVIDEDWCIGCTLCLDACPTDAILGRNKRMHTVIAPHCTGCELCIPACPVDCISLEDMTPGRTGWAAWSEAQAGQALERYRLHRQRRGDADPEADTGSVPAAIQPAATTTTAAPGVSTDEADRKKAAIAAALARARAARGG